MNDTYEQGNIIALTNQHMPNMVKYLPAIQDYMKHNKEVTAKLELAINAIENGYADRNERRKALLSDRSSQYELIKCHLEIAREVGEIEFIKEATQSIRDYIKSTPDYSCANENDIPVINI